MIASLIQKTDLSGIDYRFLIDGKPTYQTTSGGVLTLTNLMVVVILFIGFGIDLYTRKNPRATFNTTVGSYSNISLSNKNFTYAYRIEDQNALQVVNDTIAYLEILYAYLELVDGAWALKGYNYYKPKKCSEIAYVKDKEALYNISLQSWYCLDFDDEMPITGGKWDGNFVHVMNINMRQCTNSTANNNSCLPQETIQNLFYNNITSANYYYSYLYLEALPTMNDFDSPLKTTLTGHYEMTNLKFTKSNKQMFKRIQVENDKGWFFPDIEVTSMLAADSIQTDFTFKDEVAQDILFSYYMYCERKLDVYVRSYTKVQEVLANIGGFAKFFYLIISMFYSFFSRYDKDLTLLKHFEDPISSISSPSRVAPVVENSTITIFKLNNSGVARGVNNNFEDSRTISKQKTITTYSLMGSFLCVKLCKKKNRNDLLVEAERRCSVLNQGLEIKNYIRLYNEFHFLKRVLLNEEQQVGLASLRPVRVAPTKRRKVNLNSGTVSNEQREVNTRLLKLIEENNLA
jgi:hypothetical protein